MSATTKTSPTSDKSDTGARPSAPADSFDSIGAMFLARVAEMPNREAFRFPADGTWRSLTWKQTLERVRNMACGLLALGLDKEQRVGIQSSTRIEWVLADLAVLCAAGATTTVYPSNTPEECAFILADSDTRIVFAEDDSQVAKLREQRDALPKLSKVVVFDGSGDGEWVLGLDDLEQLGADYDADNADKFEDVVRSVTRDHLATLIYTSGTTGKPKGVELIHDCWVYEGEAIENIGLLTPDDLQYLWLPLSHSFGKVMLTAQLKIGFCSAIDGRIPKLVDNLSVVQPTFMAAAPRIFEKVYNKVVGQAKDAGGLKYKIFRWAVGVGSQVSRKRQAGSDASGWLALKYKVANKLVFSKLKAKFGGRVRFFISGSAPLSKDIAEFFHAADVLILEGYGLTETSAASFVNRSTGYKFGTVGPAVPGTQLRIAEEDGEILIRSRGVMRGYHGLPEKTAEVLTDDGWLHTGDIGEVDADGYLKITDRKKDLIKTSGGKYVAPQLLEGKFKAVCPYVSQIIVHGDKRNFCTALITLDEEAITAWANDNGLGDKSYADLMASDEVTKLIEPFIEQLNDGLARYETVKKFRLLPKDLSVEDGELTPCIKVKRKHVEKKYMDLLDDMYEGALTSM